MHTKYDIGRFASTYVLQAKPYDDFIMEKLSAAMRSSPAWNSHVDKILCSVEHVVYLCYCLMNASSNAERLRQVGAFILYRTNTSVTMKAKEFLIKEMPDIFDFNYQVQSGDMRGMLDSWDRANESTLAIKMRAIASYCMAFSVLEHCGFSPQFAEIIYAEFRVQKETKKVTSFAYAILDVAEFVLSRARICWDSGSFQPLFHSSNTYLDWYAKVDEVRLMSRMRGSPDDIEGLRDQDYYLLLEDCIMKGESMIGFTKTAAERKTMGMILAELKILRHNSAIEQSVSRPREEPLGVLIPGDPGIGKSSITHILGKHYATVRGIKFTPECRFDRNPFDDFMSGFKSSMWFIVMDDVACLEPNKCPAGDKSLADVIQLINMAPYTSNQAELDKKGKVPVLAKLVVANTNVLNMNVFHYFSHPSAVQRRFKFVLTPFVKEEFRKRDVSGNTINMLDGEKANEWFENKKKEMGPDCEPIPDYWDFELMEWLPVPIGGQKKLATNHYPFGRDTNGKPILINMEQFLDYYSTKIESHIKNQARMLANMAAMRSIKNCGVCNKSLQFCSDRAAHRIYDEQPCRQCDSTDCIFKHQCKQCECKGIMAKCHKCHLNCIHGIYHEFCVECNHVVQSETYMECQCKKPDCLWVLYPEAIGGVCEDCGYCMSEEDIIEESCTVCQVKAMCENRYQTQAGDVSYTTWFALYICAFLIQIQKFDLRPSLITERQARLQNIVEQGQTVMSAYDRCLGVIENCYEQAARVKKVLSNVGNNAAEVLSSRPVMVVIGAAISLLAMGKACLTLQDKFQVQSHESQPQPSFEKTDPWKVNNYILTPMDVGRKTSNYRSWTRDQMVEHLKNNLFIANVHTKGCKRTRVVAICDRYYAVNSHALQGYKSCKIDLMREDSVGVNDSIYGVEIEAHQIEQISPDISIIFIPQLPNRKDIRELFGKKAYNGTSHGYYVHRELDGTDIVLDVKKIKGYNFRHIGLYEGKAFRAYEGTCETPTEVGFCGSPLIAETALGPVILGLHSAGDMRKSVISAPLYLEDLDRYFRDRNVIDVNDVILTCDERQYQLQGLDEKSCFRYTNEGTVSIYGSLKGPRSTPTSSVQKTIIANYLSEHEGFIATHDKPLMRGYVPIHHAMNPMIDGRFVLPHSLVRDSVKDYFNTVEAQLAPTEYGLLQKLDMMTVINGYDGIRGIDKINMNTSAGFPWKSCKKNLFIMNSDQKWEMNDELNLAVKRALIVYKIGRRNNFVFTGSLKDEPREFSKILEGKTRVFTGQNVVHLLIGRQYFLSFIRVMQRNNLIFENAVGCNAHSDDWDKIAHYLIDFANNMFDGDYKNYDKSMMAMVIMEIFDGIIEFHKQHSNMDNEDFRVMRGVAYDIAYAYVDFFGDLVSFLRNNPSGHLLTVIINSICGSVYLRIGYHRATGRPISQYRYDVRAVTYGDDVIVSVNDSVKELFNFETYQHAMSTYNITFTPASKTGDSYQFKSLEEMDFLKRSFTYSSELNRFISPLNDKSIKKSLMVCLRSKTITAEEQIVATMSSAHREAWQHGRDYFDEFDSLVKRIVINCNLISYVTKTTFLSYSSLFDYYKGEKLTINAITALDGENYILQSSWISTHEQSDYPFLHSYCIRKNSTIVNENGCGSKTYQGVPRNPSLRKTRLVVKCTNLFSTLIVNGKGHRSIAQIYSKENMDDIIQTKLENTTLHTQIFDGVTGENGAQVQDKRDYINHGTNNPVDMDLHNFLARPFEIMTGTWTPSSGVYRDEDIFVLWATNPAVSRKLSNYAFIRGKMCARVVVDSTPFNYGLMHISMLAGAGTINLTSTNTNAYSTYLSQRPGGYINPSYQKSVDLSSTLLHRGEWFSLNGNGSHSYEEIGVNFTINTISSLRSATGNTTTTVSYRVYVWMEDVELAGATYVVQSMDVIPHANKQAAQKPITQDIQLKENILNPGVGLPSADLSMKGYLNVNPYISTHQWDDTMPTGTSIMWIDPCPSVTGVIGTEAECSTPLSFMDRYFDHWRGSLIFTFRVNASKYHSGSLRLVWDPLTQLGGEANVQITKVVNIQEETEFEFVVPHNNVAYAFPTDNGVLFPTSHIYTGSAPLLVTKNGILTVKVMNRLTGPSSGAVVDVVFHLRPGPDFQFLRLSDGTRDLSSSYKIQSQNFDVVESNPTQYIGETFDSVLDLMQRPQFYNTYPIGSVSGVAKQMEISETRYPVSPGPSLDGKWITTNTATFVPVLFPLSSVNTFHNTFNTFIAQMITQYVGVAGSINYSVVMDGITNLYISMGDIGVPAHPFLVPAGDYTEYTSIPLTYAKYTPRSVTYSNTLLTRNFTNWRGAQWMSSIVNNIGHFRLPHLSRFKYYRTDEYTSWDVVHMYIEGPNSTPNLDLFVSAGDDFSLIQFSGVLPIGQVPNTGLSSNMYPLYNGITRT
nr:MAG: putative polyprotein [Marnaviridae sp.]